MKATRHAVEVECPEAHEFRRIELRWNADDSLELVCKTGLGRIEVKPQGTGNHRRACFTIRRRDGAEA